MKSQVPHFEDYGYLELWTDVLQNKLDFHGDLTLFI